MAPKAKKPDPQGKNIKISLEGYNVLSDYCKDKGLVIKRFAETAILEKIVKLTKKKA